MCTKISSLHVIKHAVAGVSDVTCEEWSELSFLTKVEGGMVGCVGRTSGGMYCSVLCRDDLHCVDMSRPAQQWLICALIMQTAGWLAARLSC